MIPSYSAFEQGRIIDTVQLLHYLKHLQLANEAHQECGSNPAVCISECVISVSAGDEEF
jgi:hypothetical protein